MGSSMPETSRLFEPVMNALAKTSRGYVPLAAVFVAFTTAICLVGGCSEQKAAAGPPSVEIAPVVQRDVPIVREWVATLTGQVNAQIRAQVSGYLVRELYCQRDYVQKRTP